MKKTAMVAGAVGVLLTAGALGAHDMFLRLGSYFLEPHSDATVALVNGTFEQSQNAIDPERMTDVSIVGPGAAARERLEASRWRDTVVGLATDPEGDGPPDTLRAALLSFDTGGPGTYLIGVSTRPRTFRLTGEEFDGYLEHDGVLDALERRREEETLGTPAVETYSKHVKSVVQVGDIQTHGYSARLGYPVELVPQANPYRLAVGDTLPLLFLKDGEPVAGQLVYATYEGHHAHQEGGGHVEAVTTRTDRKGVARIPLSHQGRWYARLIHMAEADSLRGIVREQAELEEGEPIPDSLAAPADSVDYVSNWATLTWEVRDESEGG